MGVAGNTHPIPVSTQPTPAPGPIPTVTIGNPSSVPGLGAINAVGAGSTAATRLTQVAAENAPLRIVYGRQQLGAQIVDVISYNGSLVVFVCWCRGPINAVESVYFDSKQVGVDPSLTGVGMTNYTGTQVAADATLVAAYAAQSPAISYSDVLPGISYSVLTLPPNITTGFPNITAILQGLKVLDPRTGTVVYSDNAALAIADLQTNTTYGAGGTADWASVTTTANACDALVGGTEKRRTIGLVMDQVQDLNLWFEALRAYAGCFLARNAGALSLIPDRPTTSSFALSEITGSNTIRVTKITRRSKRDVPTVVAVRYTDTSVVPWRDGVAYAYAAGVQAGTVPWKIREIALPGITRFSQANREAVEQLNKLQLNDLTVDFLGQDEQLALTVGDVGSITSNSGLAAQLVRIVAPSTPEISRPAFTAEIYSAAVYSDAVVSGPAIVDVALPNPAALPAPTGLVITENAFLEQINGSALAGSLIYQSRFDISWTAPVVGLQVTYRVEVIDGGQKIRDEQVSGTTYSTPVLQQGKTYTVNVYARTTVKESPVLTGSKTVLGNTAPPNAPVILSGRELGGDVLLQISASVSVDVVRYEWRYFPNGSGTWATATLIDRVDVLSPRFKGLPVGTHRFYVAAINSVGLYSTTQPSIDVAVSSDANAFIQSRTFTNPAAGMNIVEITTEGDVNRRWATAITGDQWSTVMPSPLNSGGNAVDSYHASGTSKFQGEIWDLGSSLSGSWTLTAPATALSGTIAFYIETSPDAVTFTRQPGLSFQGSARAVRPVIEALTASTLQVDAPPTIALAVLSKPETGVVTTLASGLTLVALTGKYSAAQDLQATCLGSTSRTATRDRVLLHPQSGLLAQWDVGVGTGGGSQDAYAFQKFWTGARVVLVDDFLEYEVYIDPSCPTATAVVGANLNAGSVIVHTVSGGYAAGAVDTDTITGVSVRTGAGMDVRAVWTARRRALGSLVGLSLDELDFGGDGDGNGSYKVLLRNCRITNGAGTDRLALYPTSLGGSLQVEPLANSTAFGNAGYNAGGRSQSLQLGPANTFTLYAFNSAGTQVANDVAWSFKGF